MLPFVSPRQDVDSILYLLCTSTWVVPKSTIASSIYLGSRYRIARVAPLPLGGLANIVSPFCTAASPTAMAVESPIVLVHETADQQDFITLATLTVAK
jgi:hypothetical protein